ncbi:NAD(P)/FAD-dependent oxidoreductase [Puniceicoccaceae bacterium K14]|nr:NAD(P)/FAD-dependent oxidoreductase [Puniceicoccaceae bacterium K14]
MTPTLFDTIVIGSGTSAYYCIDALNKAGQKVAVIDARPYGGTCALRGCQPKKYLVANAEAVSMARDLHSKGISEVPRTDWTALQALKNEFLDGKSEGEVKDYKEAGVATFFGTAKLIGPDEVQVGDERLKAKHIVLATGATPRRSKFPGSEYTEDSEYFLNQPELAKRIIFIGGGYISFEFAHVAAQAGSQVRILHRSASPLKTFEPEMVDIVLESSEAMGIETELNDEPVKIEKNGSAFRLHTKQGKCFDADLIIEATGRTPNLSALEGNQGNVEHTSRGITVNAFLQSVSNPNVYAIGDCAASGTMLATIADEEGKTAGCNILADTPQPIDYSVVPSAAFTIPALASVGLSESQAQEQGLDVRINSGTTTGWPSSKRIGEKHAGYKVIINNKDNTIVGAHLARHNAAEVINIFGLAIKFGIRANELAEFLWAYPTYTSDLKYMVK